MSPDDRGRMYFLACDHRASFRRSLFGQDVLTPVTAARAGELKRIVFDGLRWAIDHGVDRAEAALLMLGRGASLDQVRSWLTTAARAGGCGGFAVGRSIWLAPLTAHLAGRADRAVTVARIGMTYQSLTRVFAQAAEGGR
jgi:hypothetical protein